MIRGLFSIQHDRFQVTNADFTEVFASMGPSIREKKHSEEDFAKGTSLVQNNIQPQNRSNSMIVKEKENAKKAFFLRMTSGSFSGMIKTKKYQNHRK